MYQQGQLHCCLLSTQMFFYFPLDRILYVLCRTVWACNRGVGTCDIKISFIWKNKARDQLLTIVYVHTYIYLCMATVSLNQSYLEAENKENSYCIIKIICITTYKMIKYINLYVNVTHIHSWQQWKVWKEKQTYRSSLRWRIYLLLERWIDYCKRMQINKSMQIH